ncbi:MAG TPA: AI-2E family transporter [Clostridiaceae bacterium]|nr:AI-2E family transporter [Clostridiaceae bacterium]
MDLNRKNILKILFIIFISIIFYTIFRNISSIIAFFKTLLNILLPFIMGLFMAFFTNVPLRFFENKVFARLNKKNLKIWHYIRRPVCLLLSIVLITSICILILLLIIPEIQQTVITILNELPNRIISLEASLNELLEKYDLPHDSFDNIFNLEIDWNNISKSILTIITNRSSIVINKTIDLTSGIFRGTFRLILAFIFSTYLLSSKEKLLSQIKRICNVVFKEITAEKIFEIASLTNNIFSRFVIGQLTEAFILGFLCYLGMVIFRMPYALTISSLVLITAFIPVFGAIIGTGIGALMILLVNPVQAFWFVIFVIVLQQIEGNIIYPRVIGTTIGLPGIWVLFVVTVSGGLFGAAGMFISVPLSAVVYYLFREFINKKLKEKNSLEQGEHFDRNIS